MICDTRLSKAVEPFVREKWNGRCMFNSLSSQARGVAIFIKKDNTAEILNQYKDGGGNILALLIKYEGHKILLEVIYGPNKDAPDFYPEQDRNMAT